MTTDLAAAAERWRTARDVNPDTINYRQIADAMELADAWIAKIPADDGEVLTERFLLDSGFRECDCPKQSCRRAFATDACDLLFSPHYFRDFQGCWLFHGVVIPSPKTRSDLRRLAEVLGISIPLNVPAKGGVG